jgi:hypothetical protein
MPVEQPNICDEMQPWLAAYALGDADEQAAARVHLAACPRCQRDFREYQRVAGLLPYSAPEAMPRPELREQVIDAVARQAAAFGPASAPALQATPAAPAARPRRARARWAALAFAALALALLVWNISLRSELDRQTAQVAQSRQNWQTMIVLLDDSSLRWYAISADPVPEAGQYAAHGHVWASPQSEVACLVAQGLPDLQTDEVYQVWLARDGEQADGGTFEAHNGKGWAFVRSGEPMAGYSEIFVTVEPAGGSATPAGPRVMSGSLSVATVAGSAERRELLTLLRDIAPLGM